MKNKILYFHIGYPKAASTFIQKNFFNNTKKINFINEYDWQEFLKLSDLIFWSNETEFDNTIKDYLSFINRLDEKKINIVSHEGYTNFSSNKNFDITQIFLRLKKIEDKFNLTFKFLFIIRKQTEYIKSRYAQGHGVTSFFSVNNKYVKFSELKNFFYKEKKEQKEVTAFETLNFYKTYLELSNIFKREPKVLIYEDLVNNPKLFSQNLINFLGIENEIDINKIQFGAKNIGKKDPYSGEYFRKRDINLKSYQGSLNIIAQLVPYKKFFFKLFSRKIKDKFKILSYKLDRIYHGDDKIVFSSDDEVQIKKYYHSGNKKLSEILNRDLNKIGY